MKKLHLDPKLVATVATAALTRAVLAVGLSLDDPVVSSAIALFAAGIVGYLTPNEGTVLRTEQEDGNPIIPEGQAEASPEFA